MPQVPLSAQMYPGRGVNTDTGQVFGSALTFDPPQVALGTGQQVRFVLESVSSSQDLAEKLKVGASAAFKAEAWGVSAEFGLANSTDVNRYYTYALMRCTVVNAPVVLRNPQFTPAAKDLLVQGGWEGFAEAYGWEYVEGLVQGGSYYGLIEVQTSSTAEQNNVKAKLSGHYGPFSASADFERDLRELQKTAAVNVSVTRSGGSGAVVRSDLAGMLEEARNFPQTALAHPVPITALTVDYRRTVPLPPIPPPNSLQRQHQRAVLQDLGRSYLRLRDYKANLEFVLSRPLVEFDQYRDLPVDQVRAARQEFEKALGFVLNELDDIVRRGAACAADAGQCAAYTRSLPLVDLPTIEGDLLSLKQLEEKVAALEADLLERGLIRSGSATLPGTLAVRGDATVGSGANGVLRTRHVDGKQVGSDAPDALFVNWNTGLPLHVGGAQPANLEVHGDLRVDPGKTISSHGRMHVAGDEHLYLLNRTGVTVSQAWGGVGDLTVEGKLGTHGRHPSAGMPPGISGGVHTFDVVAEGVIGVGPPGQKFQASMWADGAIRGRRKEFVIEHPLHDGQQLVHAAIEGPECAVYYRGEGETGPDGCAHVRLPPYFEALTMPTNRTVLVTPLVEATGSVAAQLAASAVVEGSFVVRTADGSGQRQRFYWEVKAVRADAEPLIAEPDLEDPDQRG